MADLFKHVLLTLMLVSVGCTSAGYSSSTRRGTLGGALIGRIIGHQSDHGLKGAAIGEPCRATPRMKKNGSLASMT